MTSRSRFPRFSGSAVVTATVRCPSCNVDVDAADASSRSGPGYLAKVTVPAELQAALGRRRRLLEAVRPGAKCADAPSEAGQALF